jgi:hypothetical protein
MFKADGMRDAVLIEHVPCRLLYQQLVISHLDALQTNI